MMYNTCKLSELPLHQTAVVEQMDRRDPVTARLIQLGVINGATVTPLFKSMLGDPVAYQVNDCVIALRRSECSGVTVRTEDDGHAV